MSYEQDLLAIVPPHLADQARHVSGLYGIDKCPIREVKAKLELCDSLGLRVERPNEFSIVARKDKQGNHHATHVIGWKGAQTMAMRSGQYLAVASHLVGSADDFSCDLANGTIRHVPSGWGDGEVVGVYAFAQLKCGRFEIERMSVAQVDAVRDSVYKWQETPWMHHWGEMARKTVLKRLCKRLELSTEDQRALAIEDTEIDWVHPVGASTRREEPNPTPPNTPPTPPNTPPTPPNTAPVQHTLKPDTRQQYASPVAAGKAAIAELVALGLEQAEAVRLLQRHAGDGERTLESIERARVAALAEVRPQPIEDMLGNAGSTWAAWAPILARESGSMSSEVEDARKRVYPQVAPHTLTLAHALEIFAELLP